MTLITVTSRRFTSGAFGAIALALANSPGNTQTASGFDQSLVVVLRFEGGLVDHPLDPAGRTNRGIPQRRYDEWCRQRGCPPKDVANITAAEVRAIYFEYWLGIEGDKIPRPLALILFDCAVLHGIRQCILFAERAVSARCSHVVDGRMDRELIAALNTCDPDELARNVLNQRREFCNNLVQRKPELTTFRSGWLNRVGALEKIAIGIEQ